MSEIRSRPCPRRLYLVVPDCCTDRPKVELAIRRLRARVRGEDGSVEEFSARRHDDDGEGTSGEDAAGACNSLGLFGGTRLLVAQARSWGDEKKALADLDVLAGYLRRRRRMQYSPS